MRAEGRLPQNRSPEVQSKGRAPLTQPIAPARKVVTRWQIRATVDCRRGLAHWISAWNSRLVWAVNRGRYANAGFAGLYRWGLTFRRCAIWAASSEISRRKHDAARCVSNSYEIQCVNGNLVARLHVCLSASQSANDSGRVAEVAFCAIRRQRKPTCVIGFFLLSRFARRLISHI